MNDLEEKTRSFKTSSFSAIPLSAVTATMAQNLANATAVGHTPEEEARARIATLEREARALGEVPEAAMLFHEVGLLWEDPLRNPRNAAVAFQAAYRLAPGFVTNLRAARRLFADVGNWSMVLQLLEAELNATESKRTRAGLLLDKATVFEERVSKEAEAQAALQACLALEPHDAAILTQLETAFAARGDHASVVQVYRLLAQTLTTPLLRAQALTTAALILEDRLKEREAAAELLREAFAIDRTDLLLLTHIKRIATRDGRQSELLAALQAETQALGERAAPAWFQLAKVHERAGRDAEALSALLEARKDAPADRLVLSELAAIYERTGRHGELADVLVTWVGLVTDEGEHVAINLRLAALYEEALKQELLAVGPYQAIIARIPGHGTALAGLGKLYHRMKNWEGLLGVYDAEIAASEDVRTKATRVYRAAEVLEERLKREDEAMRRYGECLQLQPGFLPAQKALTRLYEKRGQWADLVSMYEQDLLQTHDREQIIATLNKIAILHEDRLDALDAAIECMRRILEIAPDHVATLHNLARLLERAGRWAELLEVHELEAGHSNDTKQVLSLYHRNAEILDEQLRDRAGATSAYERLLQLSPAYLPALKALGRLYAQESRWADLVRMYRAEGDIAPSADHAASLAFKTGELYEHRLNELDRAIGCYEETLMLAPSYFPALGALARIYRTQGAWEKLIEVLRSEAANRTDPAERANAVYQASSIWEEQLSRTDMAIDGYNEVLRLVPGHASSLRALERLHDAEDDVKNLIAVLDRRTQTSADPAGKVAAYVRLSRLYLDRINEPARAAQCCEAGLAIDPGNTTLLRTLERIRATDRTRRGELRLRLAEQIEEPRLAHALRLAASADLERTPPEVVRQRLVAAFDADADDARTAFSLERALRQSGDHAMLRALHLQRLESVTDAQDRVSLLLRASELSEFKLGDPSAAKDAYARALELQPGLLPALQGLRRTSLKLGDLSGARAWWEREADAVRDEKGSLEALNGAAQAARALGDEDGAVTLLERALALNPLDPLATAGLEDILAQRGGARDLASLHARRGEARLLQREHEGAAEAFHAAALAWNSLKEGPQAMAFLERALAAQPTHAPSLELKGELCLAASAWSEAAAAFQLRIQEGGDPATLIRLHLIEGGLFQDRLGEPTRAAAHLQTVLSLAPDNLEALERLATIHRTGGNWTGAADCLNRLLELMPADADQARHLVSLASVVEDGFGDAPQAASLYRRALAKTPGDLQLVDRLVVLYERTRNVSELVQMLEAQAEGTGDQARTAALRMKIGELYTRSLEQPARAATAYRQILLADPTHLEARIALARLLETLPDEQLQAIAEHRTILEQEPTRLESLEALFRLWLARQELDRAFAVAGLLVLFRSEDALVNAFYQEQRNVQPPEATSSLTLADVDTALLHPSSQTPLVEVLRAIGDQLTKIVPPNLEAAGIDKRADRLRADHPVHRAVTALAAIFGMKGFDVYQSRRGTVFLETTDPMGVCVGQEVVRKFNVREQRFLIGRAMMGLVNRSAVLGKISQGESADLLGNTVRIHVPEWDGLGRRNEEQSKQLRRAASRKAVKQLEEPCEALRDTAAISLPPFLEGLQATADRAGLVVCGDLHVAMNLVLREDPSFSVVRTSGRDELLTSLRERTDLRELMRFGLSDPYFRVRKQLGFS